MDVNHVADDVSAVDENHVSADGHVAVISRRWWKVPAKIRGHGVRPPSQVAVERTACLQPGFLLRREPVLRPEAPRCVAFVLFVPVLRHLAVVIIELSAVVSVSFMSDTGSGNEESDDTCCGTDVCFDQGVASANSQRINRATKHE
jgi:hypothetical protein